MRPAPVRLAELTLLVVALGLAVFGATELSAAQLRDTPSDLVVLTSGAVHAPNAVVERVREPASRTADLWSGSDAVVLVRVALVLLVAVAAASGRPWTGALTWRRRGPPLSFVS